MRGLLPFINRITPPIYSTETPSIYKQILTPRDSLFPCTLVFRCCIVRRSFTGQYKPDKLQNEQERTHEEFITSVECTFSGVGSRFRRRHSCRTCGSTNPAGDKTGNARTTSTTGRTDAKTSARRVHRSEG